MLFFTDLLFSWLAEILKSNHGTNGGKNLLNMHTHTLLYYISLAHSLVPTHNQAIANTIRYDFVWNAIHFFFCSTFLLQIRKSYRRSISKWFVMENGYTYMWGAQVVCARLLLSMGRVKIAHLLQKWLTPQNRFRIEWTNEQKLAQKLHAITRTMCENAHACIVIVVILIRCWPERKKERKNRRKKTFMDTYHNEVVYHTVLIENASYHKNVP